jgi:hypothetical protein
MAFSLPRFVRRASPQLLRTYVDFRGIAPDSEFRWDLPGKEFLAFFLDYARNLPKRSLGMLLSDLERVEQMSDEVGERCFCDSDSHPDECIATFAELPSACDRALRVFIVDQDLFERAELLRFVEINRMG